MRIAAFPRYELKGPSSRLRFYQYEKEFSEEGVEIEYYPLFGDEYMDALVLGKRKGIFYILKKYWNRFCILKNLKNVDVVWLQKDIFPWLPAFFEKWILGVRNVYVYDYDDAVFNLYHYHRNPLVRLVLGRKIASMIYFSHGFIGGSHYLLEYAKKSGARKLRLVPTCIRESDYTLSGKPETQEADVPIIGWIGTPSSAGNLEVVRQALSNLAQRRSFRFVVVGASNLGWEEEIFEVEYVPWSLDTEIDEIKKFDIGIMPLEPTPFNEGKCGFKLIQYMACSLPVVTSSVGENRRIVSHGLEGYHAETPEQWEHAFDILLSDADLRIIMGERGRLKVESSYSIESQFPKLLSFLEEISKKGH